MSVNKRRWLTRMCGKNHGNPVLTKDPVRSKYIIPDKFFRSTVQPTQHIIYNCHFFPRVYSSSKSLRCQSVMRKALDVAAYNSSFLSTAERDAFAPDWSKAAQGQGLEISVQGTRLDNSVKPFLVEG